MGIPPGLGVYVRPTPGFDPSDEYHDAYDQYEDPEWIASRRVIERSGYLKSIADVLFSDDGTLSTHPTFHERFVASVREAENSRRIPAKPFNAAASLVVQARPDLRKYIEASYGEIFQGGGMLRDLFNWTPEEDSYNDFTRYPTGVDAFYGVAGKFARDLPREKAALLMSTGDFLRRVVTAWERLDRSSGPV